MVALFIDPYKNMQMSKVLGKVRQIKMGSVSEYIIHDSWKSHNYCPAFRLTLFACSDRQLIANMFSEQEMLLKLMWATWDQKLWEQGLHFQENITGNSDDCFCSSLLIGVSARPWPLSFRASVGGEGISSSFFSSLCCISSSWHLHWGNCNPCWGGTVCRLCW